MRDTGWWKIHDGRGLNLDDLIGPFRGFQSMVPGPGASASPGIVRNAHSWTPPRLACITELLGSGPQSVI